MFKVDQAVIHTYVVADRFCLLAHTFVLLALARQILSRGLLPELGVKWCIALVLWSIHHGIVWFRPELYNHKVRSRFVLGNAVSRVVWPLIRYGDSLHLTWRLLGPSPSSPPFKAFLLLAMAEPLSYMCVNLSSMLSFKHQIIFTFMRGVEDLYLIIPTLSDIINSSPAVAQISKAACPWVHVFVSSTTPEFLLQPDHVVCSKGYTAYTLTALFVIVGHLPTLLACYWYELKVKYTFLMSAAGEHAHARLPHPDCKPLVLLLHITAGMAVASSLATYMALAAA